MKKMAMEWQAELKSWPADAAGGSSERVHVNVSCCIMQQANQNSKWIYTCHTAASLTKEVTARIKSTALRQCTNPHPSSPLAIHIFRFYYPISIKLLSSHSTTSIFTHDVINTTITSSGFINFRPQTMFQPIVPFSSTVTNSSSSEFLINRSYSQISTKKALQLQNEVQ